MAARPRPLCAAPSAPWRRSSATPRARPTCRPSARQLFQNSCRLSDDAHLGVQHDALHLVDHALDMLDQPLDIGSAPGAARIDDEVGVLLRDAHAAATKALQPAGFDQARGMIARRVAKDAAGIGQAERLRGDAPREELLHHGARGLAVARLEAKPGAGEPFLARRARRAVAVADVEFGARPLDDRTRAVDGGDALDDVPGLAAIAAGVHGKRPTDTTGHAGEKFGALEVVERLKARHLRAR